VAIHLDISRQKKMLSSSSTGAPVKSDKYVYAQLTRSLDIIWNESYDRRKTPCLNLQYPARFNMMVSAHEDTLLFEFHPLRLSRLPCLRPLRPSSPPIIGIIRARLRHILTISARTSHTHRSWRPQP